MSIEEKAKAYYDDYIKRGFIGQGELAIKTAYLEGATEAIVSQWVSVKERLPKNKELVLVMVDLPQAKCYDLARFCEDDNDFALIIGLYDRYVVTHWMAIPPLKECESNER